MYAGSWVARPPRGSPLFFLSDARRVQYQSVQGTVNFSEMALTMSHHVQQWIMWFGILLGVLMLGLAGIGVLRRRLREDDDQSGSIGFSLDQLETLRETGELTEHEYQIARNKFLARHRFLQPPADPKGKKADRRSQPNSSV